MGPPQDHRTCEPLNLHRSVNSFKLFDRVPFQHFGNWGGVLGSKVENWEKLRSMKSAIPISKHS